MKRIDNDALLLRNAATVIEQISARDCHRVTLFIDARRIVRCTRVHYRSRGKSKRGTSKRPCPYRSELVLSAGRPNFAERLHLASLLKQKIKPDGLL